MAGEASLAQSLESDFMLLDERSGRKAHCWHNESGHSGTIHWFKNSLQVSDGQGHGCLTASEAIMTAIKRKRRIEQGKELLLKGT